MEQYHGTTIVCARRFNQVALGGDGQVTLGNIVMKDNARKVRKISSKSMNSHGSGAYEVLVGFAGATADAFALLDRFEHQLNQCNGNLERAAVELAKEWRTDRALRRLEAMMIAADKYKTLILTGNGDVLEPKDYSNSIDCDKTLQTNENLDHSTDTHSKHHICAIGSGGSYAQSAAIALLQNTQLSAKDLVEKSLNIAADMCIYTNHNITLLTLDQNS